jgi:uncharacterized protein (DUF2147 family)
MVGFHFTPTHPTLTRIIFEPTWWYAGIFEADCNGTYTVTGNLSAQKLDNENAIYYPNTEELYITDENIIMRLKSADPLQFNK